MMTLAKFKIIVSENTKADINELKKFITETLSNIPIPYVVVNKNAYIERAVLISRTDGDFDLDRLSCIPFALKHLSKEGRFNNAQEPTFYAAFTDMDRPESTRYFLATELDHSILGEQNKEFGLTATKWLSINSFNSIFLIFKSQYCTNSLTKQAYESIVNSEEYKVLAPDYKEFLELLTEEFAKPEPANGYGITNIVFDYYKTKGYESIIYPGVHSRYRGNNIAMLPNVVEKNWVCQFGAEFKVIQNDEGLNIKHVYKIKIDNKKLEYSEFNKDEIGGEVIIEK